MSGVTVTIVTACFNGASFLPTMIASVLAQTRPPLELIVIDDGSTDDSAAVVQSYGSVVRLLQQPNQGESVARNRGLAEARGSHVLFLDCDDLIAPESIARMSDALTGRPSAVGVMGCCWFEQDPAQPYDTNLVAETAFFPSVIESNLAPLHCWMAPIDLVRQAGGFYGDLVWFEDWDLWWRVGLLGVDVVPVDYFGALYRRHQKSQLATTKIADRTWGHACLMERMAAALLDRPDLLDKYGERLFWASWTALVRARRAGVAWDRLTALSDHLRELTRRIPSRSRPRTARAVSLLGPRLVSVFARGVDHPIRT